MPRTFAGFVPPLLAALALLPPGETAAGPPEGASGKMVREGERILPATGLVIIRQGRGEMTVEGPGFTGTAKRIRWDKENGDLHLEGTPDKPARLVQSMPGKVAVSTAQVFFFSPETGFYWSIGEGDVIEFPRRAARIPR